MCETAQKHTYEAAPGYYKVGQQLSQCLAADDCLGGNVCRTGWEGPFCGRCLCESEQCYSRSSIGVCQKCEGIAESLLLLFAAFTQLFL